MSVYGGNQYGSGVYGGKKKPPYNTNIPVTIELYDNNLGYKGAYQTGVGGFVGCNFTADEGGSRDFTLIFTGPQTIDKSDIIKIKLFGNPNYFFTGVVRNIPILGSTKNEFNYSGFGLNDYLLRVNVESKNYVSQTLEYIIEDIVDTIIAPKTPIKKNTGKLQIPNITISSFQINYNQVTETFDSLKNLASSSGEIYVYGVDETGDFFFRPKNLDTIVTLVVGASGQYGIPGYEPEDEFEAITKLFILDDNGALVTTLTSLEQNDIFEEKALAPILGAPDIVNWGKGILAEREINKRRASITWKIEESNPIQLLGDGVVRIISNIPPMDPTPPNPNPFGSGVFGSGLFGGGQIQWKSLDDRLQSIEVSYSISGNESIRTIQLGAIPVRLDDQVNKIRKNLKIIEINNGK